MLCQEKSSAFSSEQLSGSKQSILAACYPPVTWECVIDSLSEEIVLISSNDELCAHSQICHDGEGKPLASSFSSDLCRPWSQLQQCILSFPCMLIILPMGHVYSIQTILCLCVTDYNTLLSTDVFRSYCTLLPQCLLRWNLLYGAGWERDLRKVRCAGICPLVVFQFS